MSTALQVLIFDTGPLWELFLYRAVHTLGFRRLSTELRYLQTGSYYEKLSHFIAGFPTRVTTPHVVAEISAKIIRTEEQGRASIWDQVCTEFRSIGMDEKLLKLLEMAPELVKQFGAVDASILELSTNYAPGTSLVLSIDGALIRRCKNSGINSCDLWEVFATG